MRYEENIIFSKQDDKLDSYTQNYNYKNSVMGVATDYCASIFERYMAGSSVLELGPAEGVMTEIFFAKYKDYTAVEGSEKFCKLLEEKFPNICVVNSYFENYQPNRKFDNIILGHVLEHVDNPVEILKLCKSWLNDGGVILSAVPNSHSLHRQAAVLMGMLQRENELNDTDKGVGHQRVYNYELLKSDFELAGCKIKASGGYWVKSISNGQIDEQWTREMIDAYMRLGEDYPDIAAEIYVIAE